MTKAEAFTTIRSIVSDNAELVAFCDHELELLAKRASAPSKPTKTQIENEVHKQTILSILAESGTIMTISEIAEQMEGFSNQKVSALISLLRKENKVIRTEDKRKAYFSIA